MLWVEVISVLQFRLRLASSTCSAKIVRPSLRMPALVPPFTSSGCDTFYFPLFSLSVRELLRQSGVYPKLPSQKLISGHRASIRSRMKTASHRFRDTYAVALLLEGVPMERVPSSSAPRRYASQKSTIHPGSAHDRNNLRPTLRAFCAMIRSHFSKYKCKRR
jgi:hypothetical protein